MRKPDFIIVGEVRCGTTSLYEDLLRHPDVTPSLGNGETVEYEGGSIYLSQKELRFFDRYWGRGLEWYLKCFPNNGKIVGEASATYLFRSLAMWRIKKSLPDIKIIVMLRNPIDRLHSHFCHLKKYLPKWPKRYPTFERFVETAHENDYYLIEKGIYANSVQNCFDLFGEEQVLILKSEDLFASPQQVYNSILDFLGLSHFQPEFCCLRSSGKKRISPTLKNSLADFYGPHNERLYRLIGYDMKW
jgi:hypothetical protein